MLMRSHKDALYCIKTFWKLLLRGDVLFSKLQTHMREISAAKQRAEKTYRMILERYPTSVKVLRCYAKFLEDVTNDPWTAAKFYAYVDKFQSCYLAKCRPCCC